MPLGCLVVLYALNDDYDVFIGLHYLHDISLKKRAKRFINRLILHRNLLGGFNVHSD